MPHDPAGTEQGGRPNDQERGWLPRGKDFRLGSEDELALVRHRAGTRWLPKFTATGAAVRATACPDCGY